MSYLVNRPAQADVSDLQSLSGVPDGSTDLGTFTGNTVRDNPTVKEAIQDIETEVEDRLPDFVQWQRKDGGYYFDGAGNDYIATPSILFDDDFSFLVSAYLTPSPSATQWILSSDNGGTSTRQFELYQTTGGVLQIQVGGTNYYSANSPAITAAGVYVIGFTFDESSASGTMYINGEPVTLTVGVNTFTGMGTTALPVRIGDPLRTSGDFKGEIYSVRLFNRALSADDVAKYSRGEATDFSDRVTSASAHYTQDTSAGTDGWLANNASATGNIDAIGGKDNVLRLTVNTVASAHYVFRPDIFTTGKRYRVSGAVYVPSTNSHIDGFAVMENGQVFISDNRSSATDTWVTFNVDFISTTTGVDFYILATDGTSTIFSDAGGDDVLYIADVLIQEIGEIASYLSESSTPTLWADVSPLGRHATNNGATHIFNRRLYADAFVQFTNLQTSAAGLVAGQVWRDGNDLKIV